MSHLIACAIIRSFPSIRACRREGLACDGDAPHVHADTSVPLRYAGMQCLLLGSQRGVASAHTRALYGDVRWVRWLRSDPTKSDDDAGFSPMNTTRDSETTHRDIMCHRARYTLITRPTGATRVLQYQLSVWGWCGHCGHYNANFSVVGRVVVNCTAEPEGQG